MTSSVRIAPPTSAPPTTPWGRFALLYTVFFFMGAEMFLVSPLLPTIAHELDTTAATAAMLVTAYVLTYALAAPVLGIFADRAERRVFITAGMGLFVLGDLLCAVAPTIGLLIVARALAGLGAAAASPAIYAYLAERSAAHQNGKAIAWAASTYSVGQVLGVPLGTLVAASVSWRWAFAGVAIVLGMTLPFLALRIQGPRPQAPAGKLAALIRPWRDPRIRLGLLGTALLQAARLGTYSFAGVLFSQRFGLSVSMLGLVGLVVGLGSMIGSLLTGQLLDRVRARGHHEIWLSVGWAALFTVAVSIAVSTHSLPLALAGLFVWFLAGGAFYSTQQAYLAHIDPAQRASVVSWNNSMMNAGIGAGTSALGALAVGGTGFVLLAGGFGAAAVVSSLLLIAVSRRAVPAR